MEKNLSKRELKEQRRLEALKLAQEQSKQSMVKWIVIGVASVLFLAFFTALIVISKQNARKITLSNDGWVRGEISAKVTLTEFGDLQCPACKAYEPMIAQALSDKDLQGKVKLIFKHFPLSIHKNSMAAAKASEAAGAQGKFWEFHDLLYANQEEWSELNAADAEKKFEAYAESLKIEKTKFKLDLQNEELENKIKRQADEGDKTGVFATPTFFINNKKLENNPGSFEELKELIKKEIN